MISDNPKNFGLGSMDPEWYNRKKAFIVPGTEIVFFSCYDSKRSVHYTPDGVYHESLEKALSHLVLKYEQQGIGYWTVVPQNTPIGIQKQS